MALTAEQRKQREGKLTGSQVKVLMEDDPYKLVDLWKMFVSDPSYVEPDFSDNWPVRLGEVTEELNLDWYEKKYDVVLGWRGAVMVHENGWCAATLDGWDPNRKCPVEAKFVNSRSILADVVARYAPQYTWQMMVTKASECALSVIIGGAEPIVEFLSLDRAYGRELWSRANAFWLCVQTKTPPVQLPAAPPPVVAARIYQMDDNSDWCAFAARWVQAYGAADTAKKMETALKALVPRDAAKAIGAGIVITRNRAGALSLREVQNDRTG